MSYDQFISEFVDRAEPHTVSADDAAASLLDLALAGEGWALQHVYADLRAMELKNIKQRRQAASVVTFTDGSGRKRRMNTAVSRPQFDRATGELKSWQLVLAWDMDAAALNAHLLILQRESLEVRDRINAVRALLDALARHPECATARDAWAADGRTVAEIDLSA